MEIGGKAVCRGRFFGVTQEPNLALMGVSGRIPLKLIGSWWRSRAFACAIDGVHGDSVEVDSWRLSRALPVRMAVSLGIPLK